MFADAVLMIEQHRTQTRSLLRGVSAIQDIIDTLQGALQCSLSIVQHTPTNVLVLAGVDEQKNEETKQSSGTFEYWAKNSAATGESGRCGCKGKHDSI